MVKCYQCGFGEVNDEFHEGVSILIHVLILISSTLIVCGDQG